MGCIAAAVPRLASSPVPGRLHFRDCALVPRDRTQGSPDYHRLPGTPALFLRQAPTFGRTWEMQGTVQHADFGVPFETAGRAYGKEKRRGDNKNKIC